MAKRSRMRRVGIVLTLFVALALPGGPGSGSQLPVLAGKTVVTANISGYVDVVIPKKTRVSRLSGRNPDLRFLGDGRVVGIVLVEQGAPWNRAYEIDLTRWAFCGQRACSPKRATEFATAVHWKESQLTERHWIIPPGRYRMYVITDGAPVRLQVEFAGLDGEVHLRPQHRATIGVRQPAVVTPSSQDNIVVAEDGFEMTSPGLLVEANHDTYGPGLGVDSACFRRLGHLPTLGNHFCGAGFSSFIGTPGDEGWAEIYAWHPARAGVWESRFTYTYAGSTKGMEFLNLWVSFD